MDWIPLYFDLPIANEEGEMVGTKKVIADYHVRFSDKERTNLHRILAKHPADRADEFISRTERACYHYWVFLQQRKNIEIRQDIADSLPTLRKALKQLKMLQGNKKPFVELIKSIPGIDERERGTLGYSKHIANMSVHNVASLASESARFLEALIQSLEDLQPEKAGRGRPSIEGGFAQAINDTYTDCFQENPSLWREGSLAEILKICLDGMGLPAEDPERRLKSIRHK